MERLKRIHPAAVKGPRLKEQRRRLRELRKQPQLTKKESAEALRLESAEALREMLPPGATVATICRHVSRSGMTRNLDLYGTGFEYLTGYAANVLGWSRTHNGELRVSGCGMDMGFHTVYTLARYLYPDGFVPAKCDEPMHGRNRTPDTDQDDDGGYSLRQRWI